MNFYKVLAIIVSATSLALAAAIRPSEELNIDYYNLYGGARQLNLSSAFSNALGSDLGGVPLVGGLLSPVSNLLQTPLSSGLNSLTGGLVNRNRQEFSFNPTFSPFLIARSQPHGGYRSYQAPEPLLYSFN